MLQKTLREDVKCKQLITETAMLGFTQVQPHMKFAWEQMAYTEMQRIDEVVDRQ